MTQANPDTTWVGVFEQQHSHNPNTWVSDMAKEQHKKMVTYMTPPENPENRESEDGADRSDTEDSRQPPISDTEAMQRVLGHRSGYMRGMGRGPKPTQTELFETQNKVFHLEEDTRKFREDLALQTAQFALQEQRRDEETRKLREDLALQMTQFTEFMRNWMASQGRGDWGWGNA